MNAAVIPVELCERRQWVVWRLEKREGKATKVPYRANGDGHARADDSTTWGTFAEALAAAEAGKADGIGFVFSPDDPYAGVDLDGCRDLRTGLLDVRAVACVQALNSYTEVSPSGTGVHVIVRAELPASRNRKGNVELYDRGRFFCVTGAHMPGTATAIEARQAELEALYSALFPPAAAQPSPAHPVEADDAEILLRASAARNGADFERLWGGDINGYPSHSEADLALAGLLAFWTGGEATRVDSLFRQSGLMREKWDSRRGDTTYGAQTIARALEGRTEFYRQHAPPPDEPDTRTDDCKPALLSEKSVREPKPDLTGRTPSLALESDILGRFRADLRRAGVAGEQRLASIEYLALTSRVLPWGKTTERPISVITKGATSTGKSHATQTVLRFFPESAYVSLGSMSRRYLFYSEDDFAHRFIIVPEWASIADDEELVALLRTLLSEGRVIHGTVDRDGKLKARKIEKNGPTALLVTTTQAAVDAEMETRCLSLVTDDTPEQTRRVFDALADLEEENGSSVDWKAWHNLQTWIAEHGEARVWVPFVRALADLMPAGATRLRRDFVSLLCLVRAHAILHQAQRDRDEHGRIIATVEGDYAPIRALVSELIAEGAEASVSEATRETVEAVRALQDEGAPHVSPAALSRRLDVGRSATYDRIRRALLAGYLVDEATKDERGKKLVVGALLPGEEEFLPSPAAIVRSSPDMPPGRTLSSTIRPEPGLSGSPGRPATPPNQTTA